MFRDREFYASLARIALPIILQNLFSSSLNLVSGMLVGQLGEVSVAAVGLANQINFLLTLMLFGITSGCALFTAQLWGKGDVPAIHKVLGLCLRISLAGGFFFFLLAMFFPEWVLRIYTNDAAVVALGSQYLRVASPGFLLVAITATYAALVRTTGEVRIPLIVSMIALSISTTLGYALIFGVFGLPRLGVMGAALGVSIARALECGLLLLVLYRRKSPLAANLRQMQGIDCDFARLVLQRALPVAFNEALWSLGVTTYNIVYAHIGTEAVAAVNIAVTIEGLAFVIFIGICDACAILVGNRIGAGQEQRAVEYARQSLLLGAAGAVVMGGVIVLSSDAILALYKVSPTVLDYAHRILMVMAGTLWLRISNMLMFVGIFRSGGDTRFAFLVDVLSVWLVGVPLALLGGFVLHLPVYWVYLMVMGEELLKYFVAVWRFVSRRWLNNLANAVEAVEAV